MFFCVPAVCLEVHPLRHAQILYICHLQPPSFQRVAILAFIPLWGFIQSPNRVKYWLRLCNRQVQYRFLTYSLDYRRQRNHLVLLCGLVVAQDGSNFAELLNGYMFPLVSHNLVKYVGKLYVYVQALRQKI